MIAAEKSGRSTSNLRNECRWWTRRTNGSASRGSSEMGHTRPPKRPSSRSATPRNWPTCERATSASPCQAGHTGSRVCRTTRFGVRIARSRFSRRMCAGGVAARGRDRAGERF
eukprot:scaffold7878_cov126-Isochrysis_galbana.AAC.3